jgi:molybdopterin-dependent oxidoreductase alpha subunit
MPSKARIKPYRGPVGGWGSVHSLIRHVGLRNAPRIVPSLLAQNQTDGFACVSCAWAKPAEPHQFEFCENGAKATAWELASRRAGPEFFAAYPLAELRTWSDHDLEHVGRLVHPLRYDPGSDRFVPVAWEEAFAEIGQRLRAVAPRRAVYYASGRASLETSYLYQLMARMLGSNNLPDSSNMCHETTSVALPESIGVPVGTVRLPDFDATHLLLFLGQNVGTNSPRMLHQLQQVRARDVPVITFNPLRERGLERFTNPHHPLEMALGQETTISTAYHQVAAGGDLAALTGICKAVLALDDGARAAGAPRVLDTDFIDEHTHGFNPFVEFLRATDWGRIERDSGLARAALEETAATYAAAPATIALFGMGLTQHRNGVRTVQMLVNLLLMRGNIGREGAGICPVRGHSNVQGQRTVGITEKPELAPLDRLADQFGFAPPHWKGLDTIETCEAVLTGDVDAFFGLGGNFLRAVPDTVAMESAWRRIGLTVHVATRLNRTHLVPGEICFLLPCLGRIEIDRQASGPQVVTTEDSTACIHGSRGRAEPASATLRSETAIVAGIAKAALDPNPLLDWDGFVADYARIRDAIAATYPDDFADFNARLWQPGGFPRNLAAVNRRWNTETGRANFILPGDDLTSHGLALAADTLRLITLRSNDQFNTTIYGYRDRLRGIEGTRMVLLVNPEDMSRLGLADGQEVALESAVEDGVDRVVEGLRVTPYNIPNGCVASYFPECNPLIPVAHHAVGSHVPAAKSVPVRLRRPIVA